MNDETKRQVIYTVTLVAAFAVGLLVGKSACVQTPPPEIKTKVVTRQAPCRCDAGPAPDTAPPDTVGSFERTPPESDQNALPEAPPAPDPAQRKRLLAWVRERAPDLRGCRPPGSGQVHVTVTLDIDADGVRSVDFNAPDDEISGDAITCLERRMQEWSPPTDLIDNRKRVVFGLDI